MSPSKDKSGKRAYDALDEISGNHRDLENKWVSWKLKWIFGNEDKFTEVKDEFP